MTRGQVGLVAASALALAGCWGIGGTSQALSLCGARANNLHSALLLYATDYDDRFPPGPSWMDGITQYLSAQTSNLHCPALTDPAEYGLAIHEDMPGASPFDFPDPALVTTVFETSDLSRNAVGTLSDAPSVARHGGRNVRMLLDGTLLTEAP